MFKNPFSFEGRIRRMEYGLSIIISAVVRVLLMFILTINVVFSFDVTDVDNNNKTNNLL